MNRQLVLLIAAVIGVGCGAMYLRADPPATKIVESTGALMQAKLTNSQKVLAGLVRNDFDQIESAARAMKHISEAAEWARPRDTVYEHYSVEFRRHCSKLESLAKQQSHEAAAFTYLHMTSICIGCHDYVRDSQRIARQPGRRADVRLIPAEWPEQNLPTKD
jgi:hypothetical protein